MVSFQKGGRAGYPLKKGGLGGSGDWSGSRTINGRLRHTLHLPIPEIVLEIARDIATPALLYDLEGGSHFRTGEAFGDNICRSAMIINSFRWYNQQR